MSSESHWVIAQRRSRILQAAAASLFAMFSRIALQIGQVPVFLYFWNTERFGEWLLITSVPSYLALSGLGFGTAAGNAIAKLSAGGDQMAVRSVLRAAWLILTASCLAASIGLIAVSTVVDVPHLLGLKQIGGDEFFTLNALLCLLVFLRMQFGLSESAFRAIGRYPRFVVLENALQIAEFAGTVLALAVWRTPSAVVLAMIAVRLLALLATLFYFKARYAWILVGPANALMPYTAQLWRPSLGFLVIPFSQSLNLQGVLLIVGHFFGPVAVATLSTARTIARVVETALGLIYNVVYEEVGYAAGANDEAGLKRLLAGSIIACAIAGVGASVFIILLGPAIYQVWTHGKIALDYGVMAAVVAAGLVHAFSTPAAALLAGLNLHTRYSVVLLLSTLASLAIALLLIPTGLAGVAASSLVMELILAAYVFPKGLRAAKMTLPEMTRMSLNSVNFRVLSRRFRERGAVGRQP